MPAEPTETLSHYITGFDDRYGPEFACGAPSGRGNTNLGRVTCFACRNTKEFKADQLVEGGGPPPLIHFIEYAVAEYTLCNDTGTVGTVTMSCDKVTCPRCRASTTFKRIEKDQRGPAPFSQVIAEDPALQALAERAEASRALQSRRNLRGMFVIEERIHHGEYRSVRRVEVYAINVLTVDGVLMSSAYGYGSWQNPENPAHTEVRRAKLRQLVEDLKAGRENRDIGWSTFKLVK